MVIIMIMMMMMIMMMIIIIFRVAAAKLVKSLVGSVASLKEASEDAAEKT